MLLVLLVGYMDAVKNVPDALEHEKGEHNAYGDDAKAAEKGDDYFFGHGSVFDEIFEDDSRFVFLLFILLDR